MKTTAKKVFLAILGTSVLSMSGCETLTSDKDVNPNLAQDAPVEQILTAAQVSQGFVYSGELPRLAGIWVDYFTGYDRQYAGYNSYTVSAQDFDNAWANIYQTTAVQLRIVQQKAADNGNFQLQGIAQVMEANMFGTTTALWGDIPYNEAFRVTNVSDPRNPAFDQQSSVYNQVQAKLDEAIVNLGRAGVSPRGRDIYYGGSASKWIKAAHTLKARYYLHTKQYAQAAAQASQGLSNSSDDMLMPYDGTAVAGNQNPYYDFIENTRSFYMIALDTYAVSLLNGVRSNDKTNETGRLSYFYTDQGDYGSSANGLDPNYIDGAFAADADAPLLTYVENQLILAESQARTGNNALALAALNSVREENDAKFSEIDASSKYSIYVLSDFAPGGIANNGASSINDALIREILVEKYLSLLGQIESFNDVRRTNNLIGVPKKNDNAPNLPQRFLIPQSEVNTNVNAPRQAPSALYEKTAVNR